MSEVLSNNQLAAIADEFGTPVYVYHAEKIAQQYQKLKDAFAAQDVVFFYASKALTNINILKYIKENISIRKNVASPVGKNGA